MKKDKEDLLTDKGSSVTEAVPAGEGSGEADADSKTAQNCCSAQNPSGSGEDVSYQDSPDKESSTGSDSENSPAVTENIVSGTDLPARDGRAETGQETASPDTGTAISGKGIIRCAFAGLGRIASLLEEDELREKPCTHAGAVSANPDCIISGGFDIDQEKRNKFSEKWGCPVFENIDEMLSKLNPDILFISTHPDSHLDLVEKGINHKINTIVCEKPLADSLKSAKKIAAYHRKKTAKIMTNHERRYSNDYRSVKEIIRSGKYGKLLSVKGTLYMGQNSRIKNVLWHDGTHMADIIMYLTSGKLKKKNITGNIRKNSGTAFLSCRAGKVPVLIEAGAGRDHLVFQLELSFERGMVRVGNGVYSELKSTESPWYSGYNSLTDTGIKAEDKTAYFENMVKDAVRCVREKNYYPISSAVDGFNAVKFLSSL